ncbi:MAG TPA: MoaD/ThiS family protein, partial [Candidatus Limnocylindrales bacterium]|nr:MoaD/ThiS family protein [Candidatus Limnocylindrales bacterium]
MIDRTAHGDRPMADVHLPRSLAALFPGTPRRLPARGATVADVIADLDAQVPGIRNRILDAGPEIRTHINIFVAGERATLATPVPSDAVVHVVPAVSGGEDRFVPAAPAEARPVAPGEGGPGWPAPGGDGPLDDPRALQILSTEHWSLLTARSLVYNESFARGGMFLAVLSATLVALGLIATATGFSDAFLSVAAVVLALDLFIALATLGRISAASNEDIRYLQGMNRLRHAYFELVPGLERYFITSGFDDVESVLSHYGPGNPSLFRGVVHGLTTMPGMIGVISSGIGGVLAAVVTLLVSHDASTATWLGLGTAVAMFFGFSIVLMRAALGFAR